MRALSPIFTLLRWRERQLCNTSAQFVHKPNTSDRDRIVVPASWDRWGNIWYYATGKAWPEAWEHDLSFDDAGIDSNNNADVARECTRPSQGPEVRYRS